MAGIRAGILAASVAAAAIAGAAQADVRAGVEAWQAGEYGRAVAEWEPLAASGDADAQFNLGQAFKLGRGVPQDPRRAEELYCAAARRDHLQAQANCGLLMFQNGDREAAMPWIEQAANRGEPRAQYIYGTALFNGDLAPRDWVRAYAMMTRSAQAGLPQAQTSLEQMDQHISEADRRAGTDLARSIDTTALADGPTSGPPIRTVEVPRAPETPRADDPPVVEEPAPPPPRPAAQPARSGSWRIQLGAFRDRSNATDLWETMSRSNSALAGLQPYLVTAGPYTRLQAGPFQTQAEAERTCRAVRRPGQGCITARGS